MTEREILDLCLESGALLEGHFLLRSGLHSNRFFQAALVLQYPRLAEPLCAALAAKVRDLGAETVISPAVGGLIVGQEVARALGGRAIFADKEEGNLVLKRGFALRPGEPVIVAEDVVTRGGRVQQTIDLVRALGAIPVAALSLVDRSMGEARFDIPFHPLLRLELATYPPDDCPLCRAGVPLVRPGSK
jgi:orotate phosphoribosyltransferase